LNPSTHFALSNSKRNNSLKKIIIFLRLQIERRIKMKKYTFIVFLAVLCLSIAVVADAQKRHWRGGGEDYNYCPYCGAQLGGGEGYGYGAGHGTMHRGYDMGPGMMHRGYDTGPGMMERGYGPGMMERGVGRYEYRQSEECQKFLKDTVDLRKQLHTKRFEYSEAYRDPKTTSEQLSKLGKEIDDLQGKIDEKAPRGCW
jgi:hypothetical protein